MVTDTMFTPNRVTFTLQFLQCVCVVCVCVSECACVCECVSAECVRAWVWVCTFTAAWITGGMVPRKGGSSPMLATPLLHIIIMQCILNLHCQCRKLFVFFSLVWMEEETKPHWWLSQHGLGDGVSSFHFLPAQRTSITSSVGMHYHLMNGI